VMLADERSLPIELDDQGPDLRPEETDGIGAEAEVGEVVGGPDPARETEDPEIGALDPKIGVLVHVIDLIEGTETAIGIVERSGSVQGLARKTEGIERMIGRMIDEIGIGTENGIGRTIVTAGRRRAVEK